MRFKKLNLLLLLGMIAVIFIQCKKEDDTKPSSSDCEVISSSLQVQGKSWKPCGNGFSLDTVGSGDIVLYITLIVLDNDVSGQLLSLPILGYSGTGIYEPIIGSLWVLNELTNQQVDKTYLCNAGSLEILEHQDNKLRAKIDANFSNIEGDIEIKGTFELKEKQ